MHGAAGVPSARTYTKGAAEGELCTRVRFPLPAQCMRRRGDPAEGARRAMHWRPHACMGEQPTLQHIIVASPLFIKRLPPRLYNQCRSGTLVLCGVRR